MSGIKQGFSPGLKFPTRHDLFMGVLLAKKSKFDEWNKFHKKNYIWWAHEYAGAHKKISPSYISQMMHNKANIAGNFVGFAMNVTKLNFDELFYYDETIDERTFFGKKVRLNGKLFASGEYSQAAKNIAEQNLFLDIQS